MPMRRPTLFVISPDFDQATSVTRLTIGKALTVADRLVLPGQSYKFDQAVMWSGAKFPSGPSFRRMWSTRCATSATRS